MTDAFPCWHRRKLPPIRVLDTPAEIEQARLADLCRRRTDNDPTPTVEVEIDPNLPCG